jgi:hypothetical protein
MTSSVTLRARLPTCLGEAVTLLELAMSDYTINSQQQGKTLVHSRHVSTESGLISAKKYI